MSAVRRRVLLLLKPFDVYPPRAGGAMDPSSSPRPRIANSQVLSYLDDRCRVHRDTINLCQDVLCRKSLDWEPLLRNSWAQPIRDVDLVVTVGGDGTLLQASHFMDSSIPIVGVNSDPTQIKEVKEFSNNFDATRSTGYLCAANSGNFEQVLDDILEGSELPCELSRISILLNGIPLPQYALNDILVAHPCPAAVSRFSFRIAGEDRNISALVNCRSSGLRVSTAAGSTAAMLSAGGHPMTITSPDLQYIVREPILSGVADKGLMHGFVKPGQFMRATWYSKEGTIYIDGSHVFHLIQHGDTIEISSKAPNLKVFLPHNLLR